MSLSINVKRCFYNLVFIGSEFELETKLSHVLKEGIYDFTVKIKDHAKHSNLGRIFFFLLKLWNFR